MRLASRTSRWLRLLASRHDTTVARIVHDLRTAPALAREVARILDSLAHDEATALFAEKRAAPLPADADWLTRHHYAEIKAVRDAESAKEQAQAWDEHMRAQQAA